MTLHRAVQEAARIIYLAHEDSKDKEFELEMTWISGLDGPTGGKHLEVPKDVFDAAVKAAKKTLPEYDDSDDDEEEEVGEGVGDAQAQGPGGAQQPLRGSEVDAGDQMQE